MVINAVAKEREEAWQEHQAALARGQSTALVEYSTDDSKSHGLIRLCVSK